MIIVLLMYILEVVKYEEKSILNTAKFYVRYTRKILQM